jgi:hypothetical protein
MSINIDGDKEAFYQECGRILGLTLVYQPWKYGEITRWNNRRAGNGRFPGFGLIRMFGRSHIQIALREPKEINIVCRSKEEAFEHLRKALDGRCDERATGGIP